MHELSFFVTLSLSHTHTHTQLVAMPFNLSVNAVGGASLDIGGSNPVLCNDLIKATIQWLVLHLPYTHEELSEAPEEAINETARRAIKTLREWVGNEYYRPQYSAIPERCPSELKHLELAGVFWWNGTGDFSAGECVDIEMWLNTLLSEPRLDFGQYGYNVPRMRNLFADAVAHGVGVNAN